MRWLFSRVFWGIVLILLGVSLFLERVYGISLPLWGIFWSLVIIGIGISILIPHEHHWESCIHEFRGSAKKGEILFDEATIEADAETDHYSVTFSQGKIDLTKIKPSNQTIKIDTTFGSSIVKIDKSVPLKIKATSAFGEVRLPNGKAAAFGDAYYQSSSFDAEKPFLSIQANAVFGEIRITEV